jgi:hypothetical protein
MSIGVSRTVMDDVLAGLPDGEKSPLPNALNRLLPQINR